MIELNLILDNIDYEALAERFMPQIIEKAESADLEPWAKLLLLSAGPNAGMITKILGLLPKEKKDELAVGYINKNRDKIVSALTGMFADKGVRADILDASAEIRQSEVK